MSRQKLEYAYFDPSTNTWSSLDEPIEDQTKFKSVGEAITTCLKEYSSKVLFIEFNTGKEVTGCELLEQSTKIALSLHDFGIRQQEVIFDYLPSTILHVCNFVSTQLLNCIKTGIAFTHPKRELLSAVKRTNASVLTCYSGNRQAAEEVADEVDSVKFLVLFDESMVEEETTKKGKQVIPISKMLARETTEKDPVLPIPLNSTSSDFVAGILSSSGTTGTPKAIIRSYRNILPHVRSDASSLKDSVRVLHTPFNYISGFGGINSTIFSGGRTILCWDFDVKEYLEATQRYRATGAFLSPAHLTLLVKNDLTSQYDLSSLKFVGVGGAPVSYQITEEFKKITKVPVVVEVYGSTELGLICLPVVKDGFTCAGKPAPGTDIRVLQNLNDSLTFVGPNCEGEICVRSLDMTPGYYNSPDTKMEFIDGFLPSGDLGYFNDDGLLLIVGRLKEMIKVSLHQVAPKELEEILLSHESVAEAAVVGASDPIYGQVPRAYVVLKSQTPPVSEADLINFVNDKVADYERLVGGLVILESLPKISFGKIDKKELLQLYPRVV